MLKFAVLGLCVCGVFSWGSCPEFKPIDNFNLTAFLGTWHEIERYPNQYEILSSCVVSDYKVTGEDDSGTNMQIDMTYVRFYRSHFGSLDTLYMKGDDKGEFVIMPQYEHSPNTFILATDYETYALEYSCEVSMLFGPIEMANIMSRSSTLDADIIGELKQKLEDIGSDTTKFQEPEHENCPGSANYNENRPFKLVGFS
ncbi:insecticyanin-A-like [Convolutriloba macropyga]|uniref:insecticyanin-A-like n=1 Tax=Convolutriloba macropyga TaxID=536237 RepID=UPI003F525673